MKRTHWITLLLLVGCLTACTGRNDAETIKTTADESATASVTGAAKASSNETDEANAPLIETDETKTDEASSTEISQPATDKELYKFLIAQWKKEDFAPLYAFASEPIREIMDQENFCRMFSRLSEEFGDLLEVKDEKDLASGKAFTATLVFSNAECYLSVSFDKVRIASVNYDVRFTSDFDRTCQDGITEHYFLLGDDARALNAVYVKTVQKDAPTVLLIAGSGPSDYNEMVGTLPIFQDLARELAERGINSLRFEKRTYRYSDEFTGKYGLEEEYFKDCEAALDWLEKQETNGKLWLLGHSLGTQIAPALSERRSADGMILWNGTARHLAKLMEDQYTQQNPAFAEICRQYTESIFKVTKDNCTGANYYSVPDYYWADYNQLNTIASIKKSGLPTLILNSTMDAQIFDADLELWSKELKGQNNVKILTFEDQSHYGYKIDAENVKSLYQKTDFPGELADAIADFIKQ